MNARRVTSLGWMLVVVLALVAAGPAADPEALVRQGNAAFARQDYAAAIDLYTRAEDRIIDPGLVAFNKATALYRQGAATEEAARRLGLYRDAELHYRRALEDAAGQRRLGALYGLGTSLVQQGTGRGAAPLQEAVRCFEECLKQPDLDASFADDVRHNLELAKLLWLQAKNNRSSPDANPPDGSDDSPKKDPTRPESLQPGGDDPGGASPSAKGDKVRVQAEPGKTPIPTDQQPAPGTGNLPPVPDRDELVPMAPEDAAAHLERAAAKVLRERREHQQRSARPPASSVKDW
jgi:tetratricopeptide (TPR) repeat protein